MIRGDSITKSVTSEIAPVIRLASSLIILVVCLVSKSTVDITCPSGLSPKDLNVCFPSNCPTILAPATSKKIIWPELDSRTIVYKSDDR